MRRGWTILPVLAAIVVLAGCGQDTGPTQPKTTARPKASAAKTRPCPPSTLRATRASSTSASALTKAARQHFARFQGCSWSSRVREVEVLVNQDEIAKLDHRNLVLVTDAGSDIATDKLSGKDRAAVIEICKAGAAWGQVNLGRDAQLDIVHNRQYALLSRSDSLARPNCEAL